jgi:hypothetical protein
MIFLAGHLTDIPVTDRSNLVQLAKEINVAFGCIHVIMTATSERMCCVCASETILVLPEPTSCRVLEFGLSNQCE